MMDLQRVNAYMSKVEESEKKVLPHEGKRLKTGLDLGTAYIVLVVLDENDQPVACEKQAASVLRDGVVVDYSGACRIVRELKEKLEERLGEELIDCAIAMPAGTESSTRTHQYVAESAGFEVTNVVDEPTAANAIYQISDGVVVDIGGGTTGISILKDGEVVYIADEPTGGTHFSLVIAGAYGKSFQEAEVFKRDESHHKELAPVIKPVVDKVSSIISNHIKGHQVDEISLVGGTCCFTGIEDMIEKKTGVYTHKPHNPMFVTPLGIALSCKQEEM